jgi:hypothetical protein
MAGGASITVVLTDRAGKPVPGAEVWVEADAGNGARRRMEMKTDARGEAKVLGVPVGEVEHARAGFRGGQGLLVTSGPIELVEGRDTRVVLSIPEATESRGDLSVGMAHVVLERKGDRVEVTEALTLQSAPGTSYNGAPLRFPLPEGAFAPAVPARDGEPPAAAVDGESFVIRGPIPAEGLDVELRFEVPVRDARMAFEHRLGLPVRTTRVVSTWTAGPAELRVGGLQPAETAQLASGLAALVAMGPGPESGRLELTLSGLAPGQDRPWKLGALIVSIALLLLGAGGRLKLRGRGAERRS